MKKYTKKDLEHMNANIYINPDNIQTSFEDFLKMGKIAKILLDIGAVSINPTDPFIYSSGILSPIYTNCRILNSFPKERKIIISQLFDNIINSVGKENIDVIAGTAASGISLATYVATELKLPMVYIRSDSKSHGKKKQIEGILKEKSKVLLLTDILSTEKDVEISVKVLKEKGCEIVNCLAIFNNNLGIIDSFLKKEQINYYYLTDLDVLLTVAKDAEKISDKDKEEVLKWMENPYKWAKKKKNNVDTFLLENKENVAKLLLKINAVTINTNTPYELSSGRLSPIYTDCRILPSFPFEWNEIIESFTNIIIEEAGIQNIEIIGGTSTAGISHAAHLAERLDMPLIYIKSYTEKGEYLFNWSQVPGDNSKLLLNFIIDKFKTKWVENADIIKTEDNRTIIISKGKNSINISLNGNGDKATILIDNNKTHDLLVEKKNKDFNIFNTEIITQIEGKLEKNKKVIIVEDVVTTGKSLLEAVKGVRDNGGIVDTCLSIFSYNTKETEINISKQKIKLFTLTNLETLLNVALTQHYINPKEKDIIMDWID